MDKPLPEGIELSALRSDLALVDERQRHLVNGDLTVPLEKSIDT